MFKYVCKCLSKSYTVECIAQNKYTAHMHSKAKLSKRNGSTCNIPCWSAQVFVTNEATDNMYGII